MEKPVNPIARFLDNYFFSTTAYNTLGLLRIALCFWVLKPYLTARFHIVAETNLYEGAYQAPILIRLLSLPFPVTEAQLQGLHFALGVAAALACLGVLTRISVFVTGFLFMYIASILNASGVYNHEDSLICQLIMFMAFAPGIDSFSFDRLVPWAYRWVRNRREPFLASLAGPPVPVWGTKFILIALALVYFTAGASKMRFTGIHWLDGQTLTYYASEKPSTYRKTETQRFLVKDNTPEREKWKDGFGLYAHHYGNHKPPYIPRRLEFLNTLEQKFGEIVQTVPIVMICLSIVSILWELGSPLLLLGGWYRNLILLLAISIHHGIGVLMGLPFSAYKLVCFFMLDWELIIKTLYRFPRFRWLSRIFPVE